jgi:[acyl-carrier-protein] S-malonyltransferase
MSSALFNPETQPCLVLLSERLPPQARASRAAALETLDMARAIQRSSAESVWGGTPASVAEFMRQSKIQGWNAKTLPVSIPSHTPHMTSVFEAWCEALREVQLRDPHTPVLAGVDGQQIRSQAMAEDALQRQMVSTLEWDTTLKLFPEYGVTHVVDLGPGEDQWRLIEAIDPTLVRVEV